MNHTNSTQNQGVDLGRRHALKVLGGLALAATLGPIACAPTFAPTAPQRASIDSYTRFAAGKKFVDEILGTSPRQASNCESISWDTHTDALGTSLGDANYLVGLNRTMSAMSREIDSFYLDLFRLVQGTTSDISQKDYQKMLQDKQQAIAEIGAAIKTVPTSINGLDAYKKADSLEALAKSLEGKNKPLADALNAQVSCFKDQTSLLQSRVKPMCWVLATSGYSPVEKPSDATPIQNLITLDNSLEMGVRGLDFLELGEEVVRQQKLTALLSKSEEEVRKLYQERGDFYQHRAISQHRQPLVAKLFEGYMKRSYDQQRGHRLEQGLNAHMLQGGIHYVDQRLSEAAKEADQGFNTTKAVGIARMLLVPMIDAAIRAEHIGMPQTIDGKFREVVDKQSAFYLGAVPDQNYHGDKTKDVTAPFVIDLALTALYLSLLVGGGGGGGGGGSSGLPGGGGGPLIPPPPTPI